MTLEGYESVVGQALESGAISIGVSEKYVLDEVLGGHTPGGQELHPLHAYIASQRGIGTPVEGLCDIADFPIADGPMMGGIEISFDGPLLADTEYRVEGEIVDLVRKVGRTRGTFDLMTFRERMVGADGRVVATTTNTFVLPRRAQ